jgi:eukaryotic-like serine/threonine-protein kinase
VSTVFQQAGRYAIQRELGRGGMATVFLATDPESGMDVALKQVAVGFDRDGHEILEAEQWGAELQAHFSEICDSVPKVYNSWKDGDYFYIAMEYVDGINLSDLIATPLPRDRAVQIAIELCRFLEAAHAFTATIGGRTLTSLHHSDLKPRNIRITSSGHVKVLDFGIAKALSLSRKVTRNDFGSVPYLSPERLESNDIDAYSDLWALGVVFYEMLQGRQPFAASDTRQLERRILSRVQPPPISDQCPVGLQAIAAKLLASRIDDRYATAAAIRADLERFARGECTTAEEQGWPKSADEAPTMRTSRAQTNDAPEDDRTRRTTRPLAAPAPPTVASTATPAHTPAAPRPKRRRLLRRALQIAALLFVINEIAVGSSANQLARAIPARQLPELDETWQQYDRIRSRSYLHFGTVGLRRAIVARTMELSERVIASYRNGLPTLREAQWLAIQAADARALEEDPDNRQLKAAGRLSDGHLHRIAGDARQTKHDPAAARREYMEAVTAFREAAELRPNWPDPFLGLMRTFIYGLDDLDRGEDALRQAERFGYSAGSREIAQLADGYRARGERLARYARVLRGLPQEQPSLEKAADAFRHAIELYGKVTDFAQGAANIRLAQHRLDQVELRLTELSFEHASDDQPSR